MRALPLHDLPIICAPMAGGPSTPDLVIAVADAGGLGLLAGGYLTPIVLAEQILTVRAAGCSRFGVNLFLPASRTAPPGSTEAEQLMEYRSALSPLAGALGALLPDQPVFDDDAYPAKLDLLLHGLPPADRPPLISFTFGLPSPDDVRAIHAAGIAVVVTATNPEEITAAWETEADALVVQGVEAGGHRATFQTRAEPSAHRTEELVQFAVAGRLPVIAAGGTHGPRDVRRHLSAGASAVQLGTAFLLADEAGTRAAHRTELLRGRRPTTVTRAFSGRPARALANDFTDEFSEDAPAAYPQVHHLTAPLRAAAARIGEAELLNLWAGEGYADWARICVGAPALSAGEIIARIAEGAALRSPEAGQS
jgi:nitronate monooxygenase